MTVSSSTSLYGERGTPNDFVSDLRFLHRRLSRFGPASQVAGPETTEDDVVDQANDALDQTGETHFVRPDARSRWFANASRPDPLGPNTGCVAVDSGHGVVGPCGQRWWSTSMGTAPRSR